MVLKFQRLLLALFITIFSASNNFAQDASSIRGRNITTASPLDQQGLGWGTSTRKWQYYNFTLQSGTSNSCTPSSNSGTTYTCSPTPAFSSYTTGLTLAFKPDIANTGSFTINVNSLGAKTVQKVSSGALTNMSASDVISGAEYTLIYNGTVFVISGGIGSSSSSQDFGMGVTGTTALTLATGYRRVGNYLFNQSVACVYTITSGTGQTNVYLDTSGVVVFATDTITASITTGGTPTCLATSGSSSVPPGGLQLASCSVSSGTATCTNTQYLGTDPFVAGDGPITVTTANGVKTINISAERIQIDNEVVTGTTVNRLVKITGAPSTAKISATTDTSGVLGICISGCSNTGTATIQTKGLATCDFENATTAGDYVQIGSSTAGKCHDAGSTYPTSGGQVLGRVLSTNGSSGSYSMAYEPEVQPSSSSGSGNPTAYKTAISQGTSCPSSVTALTGGSYSFPVSANISVGDIIKVTAKVKHSGTTAGANMGVRLASQDSANQPGLGYIRDFGTSGTDYVIYTVTMAVLSGSSYSANTMAIWGGGPGSATILYTATGLTISSTPTVEIIGHGCTGPDTLNVEYMLIELVKAASL